MKNDIIISLVYYNNDIEIISFVDKLSKCDKSEDLLLLITCNGTRINDNTIKKINRSNIQYNIYYSDINLGYLYGNLYGINQYRKKYSLDKVIITNTDIEFERYFFTKFESEKIESDVWCVGFNINNINDHLQTNPYMTKRPLKIKMKIKRAVFNSFVLFRLYNYYYSYKKRISCKTKNNKVGNNLIDKCVYAVHGCCFAINNECIDNLNKFFGRLFLYEEEELIAALAYKNNRKIIYLDNLKITHTGFSNTSKLGLEQKYQINRKSINFIYYEFFI